MDTKECVECGLAPQKGELYSLPILKHRSGVHRRIPRKTRGTFFNLGDAVYMHTAAPDIVFQGRFSSIYQLISQLTIFSLVPSALAFHIHVTYT